MAKVHWNHDGITCAQEAGHGRRERPKMRTNDPAKVTCARCRAMFPAARVVDQYPPVDPADASQDRKAAWVGGYPF